MTAMMTVTCQTTLMKLRISLDAGVRCIFDWNSRLSRKRYEIGTDPVNIKHHVARFPNAHSCRKKSAGTCRHLSERKDVIITRLHLDFMLSKCLSAFKTGKQYTPWQLLKSTQDRFMSSHEAAVLPRCSFKADVYLLPVLSSAQSRHLAASVLARSCCTCLRLVSVAVVKVVLWSRGGVTWRGQVGANPIPIPTPLIWCYLGIK